MEQTLALFFAFVAGMFVGIGINEASHAIQVWIGRRENNESDTIS